MNDMLYNFPNEEMKAALVTTDITGRGICLILGISVFLLSRNSTSPGSFIEGLLHCLVFIDEAEAHARMLPEQGANPVQLLRWRLAPSVCRLPVRAVQALRC